MTIRQSQIAATSAATAASAFPTMTIRRARYPIPSSSHNKMDRLSKVILRLGRRTPKTPRRARAAAGGAGGSDREGGGGGGGGGIGLASPRRARARVTRRGDRAGGSTVALMQSLLVLWP